MLRSLGINFEHFGPLFSAYYIKIANQSKIRKGKTGTQKNFLSSINQEITARENFEDVK